MTHTPATEKIYFSNEYARFKMINGNRQLNDLKIKKIIKEINEGNDMLRYYPIQVRENKDRLDILDGQHRFYICKKLKRPVFYILVQEDKSMPDIAKINSNVEKWKSIDFVNCYVAHNNKSYEILQAFLDEYKFSISVALILLQTGQPGSEGSYPNITEDFRNGRFEANYKTEAYQLAEDCKLFSNFKNWRSRAFVIAIYRIKKGGLITLKEIFDEYQKRPEMLTEQANYKSYINTLEQIVNVRKQKRIVIV